MARKFEVCTELPHPRVNSSTVQVKLPQLCIPLGGGGYKSDASLE